LAVVAVDLESGTEVILDSGRVIDALLATSAFPGVFAPVVLNGHYLIDGGALNNVPFDVARHLGADYVIACNVTAHRSPLFETPPVTGNSAESFIRQLLSRSRAATLWAVVDRTIAIMQDGHVQDKMTVCPPDVMLCPEIGHVGLFDLHQFDSCLEAGMAAVHEHEAELDGWREKTAQPPESPSVWEKLCRRFVRM
jgi:NTE family protein